MEQDPYGVDRILGYVDDCRDSHVAASAADTCVIQGHPGLSTYG